MWYTGIFLGTSKTTNSLRSGLRPLWETRFTSVESVHSEIAGRKEALHLFSFPMQPRMWNGFKEMPGFINVNLTLSRAPSSANVG